VSLFRIPSPPPAAMRSARKRVAQVGMMLMTVIMLLLMVTTMMSTWKNRSFRVSYPFCAFRFILRAYGFLLLLLCDMFASLVCLTNMVIFMF
jgi:hypothetical protein